MIICKATIHNMDQIMNILKLSIDKMIEEDLDQWDNIYPNRDVILNDISNKNLYICMVNSEIIGFMVLNTFQDEEYKEINWELNDDNPLVIHRLCIHPNYQGKGIAKSFLNFAETQAKNNNHLSIRLDCFTKNKTACHLYTKNGYKIKGTVTFRKGTFYCLEKQINNI